MDKEELFAAAKHDIFGAEPECPMARIGRNMAMNYFGSVLKDAEAVMLDMRMPHGVLATALTNAFTFSQEPALDAFPAETRAAVKKCADNFEARYQPLLDQLTAKAA